MVDDQLILRAIDLLAAPDVAFAAGLSDGQLMRIQSQSRVDFRPPNSRLLQSANCFTSRGGDQLVSGRNGISGQRSA